jgi:hypothetical protein
MPRHHSSRDFDNNSWQEMMTAATGRTEQQRKAELDSAIEANNKRWDSGRPFAPEFDLLSTGNKTPHASQTTA